MASKLEQGVPAVVLVQRKPQLLFDHLERIVEVADAGPRELAVRRINAGLYALPAPAIFDQLRRLGVDADHVESEWAFWKDQKPQHTSTFSMTRRHAE